MASISPITLDTMMKNAVHNWTGTTGPKPKYTFRGEKLPPWLTRNAKGQLAGLFPSAPQAVANAIDSRAFGSSRSKNCYEGMWRRYNFIHALPQIIEGLEDSGLGGHAYTDELRRVLFFADMWVADQPDILWTGAEGGTYQMSVNGFEINEIQ